MALLRTADMAGAFHLAIAAGLFALLGCANIPEHPHEIFVKPGYGTALTRVVIAPMNYSVGAPSELRGELPKVLSAVESYVKSQGISPDVLSRKEYAAALSQARQEAGSFVSEASAEDASAEAPIDRTYAALLQRFEGVDALIVPNVVMRTAKLLGSGTLSWDGVRRSVRGATGFKWEGQSGAASLVVSVFDRQGREIYSGIGGLDGVFAVNLVAERYEVKDDLFASPANLLEGTCVAFHPLFGATVSC